MKTLPDSGIVNGRKEGKWTRYSISMEELEKAQKYLDFTKNNRKEGNYDKSRKGFGAVFQ